MTKILRAARYLRVSKAEQDPALQDDETAELIAKRGWKLVDTYTDHGVSGSREKRPELDRLLGDVRRRRIDVVVVWKADRLFRSLKAMVTTLDEWAALGVGLVSATEVFDSTTPQGKLLLHLTSAFAEFERNLIIERTKAGIAAARRRGLHVGHPRARVDHDHLRDLRAEGCSVRKIASILGRHWSLYGATSPACGQHRGGLVRRHGHRIFGASFRRSFSDLKCDSFGVISLFEQRRCD